MPTAVLMLSERRPDADALGGTEVHIAELLGNAPRDIDFHSAYTAEGRLVVEAWRGGRRAEIAALVMPLDGDALDRPALREALVTALLGTASDVLHVHSPALGPRDIAAALDATGARCIVTLHDHALACENPHLLERDERFCHLPDDVARCDRCLALTLGKSAGRLSAWRGAMSELVARADAVIAPSASVAKLVGFAQPLLESKLCRIPWGVPQAAPLSIEVGRGPLRIAVVGVLADIKGFGRLPELLASATDLDVEWHLFGAREGRSVAAIKRSTPRLVIHGAYRRSELAARLALTGCELALLPSVAPEAFGLVLAELAAAGCPALVSRLGAFEERIAELGAGWTFDPWKPAELRERLEGLLADREKVVLAARALRQVPPWTPADMTRSHALVWRQIAALGPRRVADERARHAAHMRLERERRRASLLVPAVRALRRSSFYRDLGVRSWVPEAVRARIERRLSAWMADWRDRGDGR
jgi:glycosyltransferase involved in cell wall biosynthesis